MWKVGCPLTGRLPSPERLARLRVEDRIPAAKPTWALAEKLVPREVRVVVVELRAERETIFFELPSLASGLYSMTVAVLYSALVS